MKDLKLIPSQVFIQFVGFHSIKSNAFLRDFTNRFFSDENYSKTRFYGRPPLFPITQTFRILELYPFQRFCVVQLNSFLMNKLSFFGIMKDTFYFILYQIYYNLLVISNFGNSTCPFQTMDSNNQENEKVYRTYTIKNYNGAVMTIKVICTTRQYNYDLKNSKQG